MTRNDIAAAICRKHNLTKSTALSVLDDILAALADSFVNGENAQLRGFGTFEIRNTAQKTARIITTGESIIVPAGRTVKFRPCKVLKKRINNADAD